MEVSTNGHTERVTDPHTGVTIDAPTAGDGAPAGTTPTGAPARRLQSARLPTRPVHRRHAAGWHRASDELRSLERASARLSHSSPTRIGSASRQPILKIVDRLPGSGPAHQTQLLLWHVMREYIPTLDAAIGNRRQLEGNLVIESEDEGLQDELRTFWDGILVGRLDGEASFRGGDFYLNMLAENADEYGLSAGEMIVSDDARSISRLVVPNTRSLSTADRNGDGLFELYQNDPSLLERPDVDRTELSRLDNRPTVQSLAFRPSTESEWPYPLAWSLKKVGEAFLRIVDSTINGWWRFGDPSMLFNLEFDPDSEFETVTISPEEGGQSAQDVPQALVWLKEGMEATMKARRQGNVGDMYSYVDGGELSSEVIGEIDSTLMGFVQEHQGHLAAQIIEHSHTPPWMYPSITQVGDGLGSSRSTNMALVAAVAAGKRNDLKRPLAREILNTELTLRGDSQYVGQFSLSFDELSIVDEKVRAEADLTEAQAEQIAINNAGVAFTEDGERRFTGEAEQMLQRKGVYQSED